MASDHFTRPLCKTEFLERLPTVTINDKIRIHNKPVNPSGVAKKVPIEKLMTGLYKKSAKMNAFKMKSQNVSTWIQVFAVRYYSQLGESEKLVCGWRDVIDIDEAEEFVDEIRIQITDNSKDMEEKLFTISIYLNTHTVTIQGNYYQEFCETEFPILKALVDELQNEQLSSAVTELDDSLDESITENNNTVIEMESSEPEEEDETNLKTIQNSADTTITQTEGTLNFKETNTEKTIVDMQKGQCPIKKTTETHNKSSNPAESKAIPQNITDTINTLHMTLQKLEGQYCEFMKFESDVKTIQEKCKSFENKFLDIDMKIENLEKLSNPIVSNEKDEQLNKLRDDFEKLRDEKRKKEDELLRTQFSLDRLQHTLDLEKERNQNDSKHQQEEMKKLKSDINRLREENRKKDDEIRKQKLEQEHLRQIMKQKDDDIKRLEHDNEQLKRKEIITVHEDIPLQNRYELPQPAANTAHENEIVEESLIPAKPNKALIIIDSIGRDLHSDKMYRNNKVKIVKLTTGQKTIKGAYEYIEKSYEQIDSKTEIVLAVGGNDLANLTTEETIDKYKSFIKVCHQKLPMNVVSILPPLMRLYNREYSRKLNSLTAKLKNEMKSERVKIIDNDTIKSKDDDTYCFTDDGVHLSHEGTLSLVGIFKTHLNSQFDMAPYSEYKQRNNRNSDFNYGYDDGQSGSFRPQKRPWGPRYHQQFNRLNQHPNGYRPRPGQFDFKSALVDIVNRM